MTQRYKITIEYDGTGFVGWQRQSGLPSVQQSISDALFKLCGEREIDVVGSGRTDAGVHARAQVAHFDITDNANISCFNIEAGLNYYLKDSGISIINVKAVDEHFHARFSAVERSYKYLIINRSSRLSLFKDRAWHVWDKLDVDAMDEASKLLIGTHDFSTFRAAACQANSPVKTINFIEVNDRSMVFDGLIEIYVRAPSFIHHQIRNFAGSLYMVGSGKWSVDDFAMAFKAKDRTKGGQTAPACGLYLWEIHYCDNDC